MSAWSARPSPAFPSAVVQGPAEPQEVLADARIGAVVVGPGLGRSAEAGRLLDLALASGRPLVLDADALGLLAERGLDALHGLAAMPILTPHEGEFARLFPALTAARSSAPAPPPQRAMR